MTVIIWALLYFPRSAEVETTVTNSYQAEVATQAGSTSCDEQELCKRIDAAYLEQSYMGRFGKFVQPVFAPAGYDWKITVGVLASFPAREVIISWYSGVGSVALDTWHYVCSGWRNRRGVQ